MKNAKNGRLAPLASTLLALVWATTFNVGAALAQQSTPLLQITSPADSTVVNPGQTISVMVASPAGASFAEVGVVGEDPIDLSSAATSIPATFSVTIPSDIACRKFMLTAVGATTTGQSAHSATILIDVAESIRAVRTCGRSLRR